MTEPNLNYVELQRRLANVPNTGRPTVRVAYETDAFLNRPGDILVGIAVRGRAIAWLGPTHATLYPRTRSPLIRRRLSTAVRPYGWAVMERGDDWYLIRSSDSVSVVFPLGKLARIQIDGQATVNDPSQMDTNQENGN